MSSAHLLGNVVYSCFVLLLLLVSHGRDFSHLHPELGLHGLQVCCTLMCFLRRLHLSINGAVGAVGPVGAVAVLVNSKKASSDVGPGLLDCGEDAFCVGIVLGSDSV